MVVCPRPPLSIVTGLLLVVAFPHPAKSQPSAPVETSTPASPAVASSYNQFAFRVFRETTAANESNAAVAPHSIFAALDTAKRLTRNETQRQIVATLLPTGNINRRISDVPDATWLRSTSAALNDVGGVSLNGAWVQKGVLLGPSLANPMEVGLPLYEVDFTGSKSEVVGIINAWAHRSTAGRIQNIVDENQIAIDTRIFFANAFTFNRAWGQAFPVSATRVGNFKLADGTTIETEMMRIVAQFRHGNTDSVEILELPFESVDKKPPAVMLIVLPLAEGQFDQQLLTADNLERWTQHLESKSVFVSLPKFSIRSTHSLRAPLSRLGIRRLFNSDAEFKALHPGSRLDEITQAVELEVNEGGARAAAVTSSMIYGSTSIERTPLRFTVNRPFWIILQSPTDNVVLLIAKVLNPQDRH